MNFSRKFARFTSSVLLTMAVIPAQADPVAAPAVLPAPPPIAQGKVDLNQLEKSLFPSDNQPLAFNHVIVPLEAFTIQRIDPRAAKFFDPADVIQVKNSRGEAVHYAVTQNARDLYSFLIDKKYKITVVSGLDQTAAKTAMAAIQLPRSGNVTLDKVAKLGELDWTEKLSIKDFGDVNTTLAIGYTGLDIKPADQVIDAGPYYFPYTDYQAMVRVRPKSGDQLQYFAQDEKSWKAERFKVARVLFILKEANKQDKANFQANLKVVNKTSPEVLSENGRALTDGKWSRLEFAWELSKDKKKAEGCVVRDKIAKKSVQEIDIDNCIANLGTKAKFAVDKKTQRVTSCDLLTRDGELIRKESSPARCLQGVKELNYAKEYTSQKCSVFTENGVFITTFNDDSKCGKNNSIYDSSNNAWLMFESFAGMEKLSPKALIKRVGFGWDPRTPLRHKESLLAQIISNESNAVQKTVHADCVAAVKKHIQAGYSLASKKVISHSLAVEKFPRPDVSDNTFFHYTPVGDQFDAIIAKKGYAEFFSFLRERAGSLWGWVLYVAGDNMSSKSYGPAGYKFTFKPGTLIFFSQGDKPGVSSDMLTIDREIKEELTEKSPELAACDYDGGGNVNLLTYLAAESSNVGAVAYWGVGNFKATPGRGNQWLQILDAWSIKSIERIQ